MHHTPWTKPASSLPSDKIRPTTQSPAKTGKASKGKAAAPEPPKSKAVRQLESLRNALTASYGSTQKDPKGGCYCQARQHALSTHNALCRNCGLVLCEINLPHYACPHCTTPLLTPTQRDALLARLEDQIAETLTKEALLRERAAEDARRAVGAFPTLGNLTPSSSGRSTPAPPAAPQTRTVMSLNSKTKKVTVSSFTSTPVQSRPASRAESVEEEPVRVGGPPAEVPFAAAAKLDPLRPWMDLSGGGAVYIAAPNLDGDEEGKTPGKKRRKNKGKAKENEGEGSAQVNVPVAGGSGASAV